MGNEHLKPFKIKGFNFYANFSKNIKVYQNSASIANTAL